MNHFITGSRIFLKRFLSITKNTEMYIEEVKKDQHIIVPNNQMLIDEPINSYS